MSKIERRNERPIIIFLITWRSSIGLECMGSGFGFRTWIERERERERERELRILPLFCSSDLGCFADGISLEGARNGVKI
jgi:hypothetical protein